MLAAPVWASYLGQLSGLGDQGSQEPRQRIWQRYKQVLSRLLWNNFLDGCGQGLSPWSCTGGGQVPASCSDPGTHQSRRHTQALRRCSLLQPAAGACGRGLNSLLPLVFCCRVIFRYRRGKSQGSSMLSRRAGLGWQKEKQD